MPVRKSDDALTKGKNRIFILPFMDSLRQSFLRIIVPFNVKIISDMRKILILLFAIFFSGIVNSQIISGTVVTGRINSVYLKNTGGENPDRRISTQSASSIHDLEHNKPLTDYHIISANAYLGSGPMVEALKTGAQVCYNALSGGVTISQALDTHGKSLSYALLEMEIEYRKLPVTLESTIQIPQPATYHFILYFF